MSEASLTDNFYPIGLYPARVADENRVAIAAGATVSTPPESRPVVTVYDAKRYDIDSLESFNGRRFRLRPVEATLSADTAHAAAGSVAACVFVNDTCDAAAAQALADAGVGLLALRCSGFNNVDLRACSRLGIDVVRVPSYSPHAVAEHTLALALMLNRKLHLAYLRNQTGAFTLDGLIGFDMHGKTAGVIGTGQIGRCFAEALLGLGCRVIAYDPHPNADLQSSGRVEYSPLDELFARSDLLSLHVPLVKETHHLIDRDAIAKMKRGVMLLNTSRGGLVDARALIDGLK